MAGMETTVPARVVEINYTLPLLLLGLFVLALLAGLLVLVVVRGRRGKSAELWTEIGCSPAARIAGMTRGQSQLAISLLIGLPLLVAWMLFVFWKWELVWDTLFGPT